MIIKNISLSIKVKIIVLSVVLAALFSLIKIYPVTASPPLMNNECRDIELVFARGSGQDFEDREHEKVEASVIKKIQNNGWTTNLYELGTESFGGEKYPAVSAGLGGQMVNAKFGWNTGTYRSSVHQGKIELSSYLYQRAAKCTDARFVLIGYSQGAHVIGDALEQEIGFSIREKIAYIAYFGEPRLWLPEGRGIWPAACRGGELSEWRKGNPACTVSGGILSGRNPYIHNDLRNKIGSWCDREDGICTGKYSRLGNKSHGEYSNNNAEVDQAARRIALAVGFKNGGPVVPMFAPAMSRNQDTLANSTEYEIYEPTIIPVQTDYYLQPGEEASFAIADSYGEFGGELLSFGWDFNDDGVIDKYGKSVSHTFTESYDGVVRVISSSFYGARVEAEISIYVGTVPLEERLPEPTSAPTITVLSNQEDSRTVKLSWAEQDSANGYMIYNDEAYLGIVEAGQNSLEIEGVVLVETNFKVNAVNEYGNSEGAIASLAAYEPVVEQPEEPEQPQPPKQSLVCRALQLIKPYTPAFIYKALWKAARC